MLDIERGDEQQPPAEKRRHQRERQRMGQRRRHAHHRGGKLDRKVPPVDRRPATPATATRDEEGHDRDEIAGAKRFRAGIAARSAGKRALPARPAHDEGRDEAPRDQAEAGADQGEQGRIGKDLPEPHRPLLGPAFPARQVAAASD